MLLASRKEDECVRVGELAYYVAEYENLKKECTSGRVIMADPEFQEEYGAIKSGSPMRQRSNTQ